MGKRLILSSSCFILKMQRKMVARESIGMKLVVMATTTYYYTTIQLTLQPPHFQLQPKKFLINNHPISIYTV